MVGFRSLITQIGVSLMSLFLLTAGTIGFTLYEVQLRKHDYTILNLAAQLRVVSETLVSQARDFRSENGGGGGELFLSGVRNQTHLYSTIIDAFRKRELPEELTGLHEPLRCSWDSDSIAQLDRTAILWSDFSKVLTARGDEPRALADYILENGQYLQDSSLRLSQEFQHMMEGKLRILERVNQGALLLFAAVGLLLFVFLRRDFSRPLGRTLEGFERVSRGDFGYQTPVTTGNEIGRMAVAFNQLSCRIQALFRLSERINAATSLDSVIRFIFQEFRELLPLDWVGLLVHSGDGTQFVLERCYSEGGSALREGDRFNASGSLLSRALEGGVPLHLGSLSATATEHPGAEFARRLHEDGRRTALFFPLGQGRKWATVVVFAVSDEHAYGRGHLELLANISHQVGQGFEKTVVTENLVVSAVEGLAKLAESRDPETGDHLVRMALYSAVLAEELANEPRYQGVIDRNYARDIHRFAPMHDIGKVGIGDDILLKPGRLTPEERSEMERHPVIGAGVLRRSEEQMNAVGHSVFRLGIEIAEGHHEKWDGSGYPAGLSGEAIPLAARIVAAADVFDALTSKRPYKEAWPVEKALEAMRDGSGRHFDPQVIAAMERALPRIMEIYERHKHV